MQNLALQGKWIKWSREGYSKYNLDKTNGQN